MCYVTFWLETGNGQLELIGQSTLTSSSYSRFTASTYDWRMARPIQLFSMILIHFSMPFIMYLIRLFNSTMAKFINMEIQFLLFPSSIYTCFHQLKISNYFAHIVTLMLDRKVFFFNTCFYCNLRQNWIYHSHYGLVMLFF